MDKEEFLKYVKKWRRQQKKHVTLHHMLKDSFELIGELDVLPVRPVGSDCRIGID